MAASSTLHEKGLHKVLVSSLYALLGNSQYCFLRPYWSFILSLLDFMCVNSVLQLHLVSGFLIPVIMLKFGWQQMPSRVPNSSLLFDAEVLSQELHKQSLISRCISLSSLFLFSPPQISITFQLKSNDATQQLSSTTRQKRNSTTCGVIGASDSMYTCANRYCIVR